MKIGVLQTGLLPEDLTATYGEYDRVFGALMRRADPAIEIEGWRVVDGGFPPGVDVVDGWIISGSKHGVYEDHPWIPRLKDFIREAAAGGAPMIGVCFGHQIMAEALGGRAEKFAGGWSLGPKEYDVVARPGWMRDAPARLLIPAVHQDQVTMAPPDATRAATSEFCANAALLYGDPERPYAISIQPHPEFTVDFMRDLIASRRGGGFPDELSDAALARLSPDAPPALDGDWAARWFFDFLKLHKN
ncbi:type 1 glutamine amidotransferase [Pikeienuella piscinae]|uniref:Type 1 glutamine amidotransferase n=1 Tax=Pikeienuella piscinae TaxID=2748098 RepID=A0A7L5BZ95_9RHOB|nr:type 1 glutamine amidotransferase [Pikeienuella piscinae]QIE55837.1 type 1 glutamine amidotransferase [Pikeienuella piscinae]